MKKLLSLVLALCMACMLIPAMAEEDLTGDWYGSLMGMNVTVTLNADNAYAISMSGSVAEEGTWAAEDGKVTLTPSEGGSETIFEIQETALYANMDGMELTLTRNAEDVPAGFVAADVKADAAAEDFYGEWTCSALEIEGMTVDIATYSSISGSTMPGLKISADAIEFVTDDPAVAMLNMFNLVPTYADGALTAAATLEAGENSASMNIQVLMLQDGQIKAVIDSTTAMTLYFAPAAAAEEPAA